MYRNRLEKLHWDVLEQDRILLEAMDPNAHEYEHLYNHDMGLARVRREMRKKAEAQLAELAALELERADKRAHALTEA